MLDKNETQLLCIWEEGAKSLDNGLNIAVLGETDAIGSVTFEIKGRASSEPEYEKLLRAKVFEIFGVYDVGVAAAAISECISCITVQVGSVGKDIEKAKTIIKIHTQNVFYLFQEIRPRDCIELMLVSKMIILHIISNQEFMGLMLVNSSELKTTKQMRGIKLSRLFLEFKDKLDKHRKPDQHIHVQHNHIHNEGQAIIGSQLSSVGGR